MSIRAELLPPFGICCLWTAAFSILIIILPMAALKLKKKKEGLALILLDEKSLPGWYTCGDFIWLFFKHSEREAKNLFHLRAIKWIPESLAPARRRGLFFPPGFITHFLSLAPAEGMLTFLSQSHISSVRITQGPPWLSANQCFPKHVRHYAPRLKTLEKCCVPTFMWSN